MTPPLFPKDKSHLNTLVICQYVMAGLVSLGLVFLILHFVVMRWVVTMVEASEKKPAPDLEMMMPLMTGFYLLMALIAITLIIMNVLSARFMKERRKRTFSMVTAGLNCLGSIPGIVLAVFTFIVLCRDSVKAAYQKPE